MSQPVVRVTFIYKTDKPGVFTTLTPELWARVPFKDLDRTLQVDAVAPRPVFDAARRAFFGDR